MRKAILGLAVLASLVFAEESVQEQVKKFQEKGCNNGNSLYCQALGQNYFFGANGFSKDYQKAKFYLEKVCKKGNEKDEYFLEACSKLGSIYGVGGYGVQQDYKKALELYTLACDGGDAVACGNIGAMYSNGRGVPQDSAKGAGYFERACNKGVWLACGKFTIYHYNLGNQSKAAQYFKKACELGKDDYTAQNFPEEKEQWQTVCSVSAKLK